MTDKHSVGEGGQPVAVQEALARLHSWALAQQGDCMFSADHPIAQAAAALAKPALSPPPVAPKAEQAATQAEAPSRETLADIVCATNKGLDFQDAMRIWKAIAAPTAPTGAQADSALPLVADTLTDEEIERAWWSLGTEPDGSNLAGGCTMEGWKRAVRWARAIPEQAEHLAKGTQGADK
jgi:hypothetical protein